MHKIKIGCNQLCPCGSNKKHKHCHPYSAPESTLLRMQHSVEAELKLKVAQIEAKRKRIIDQQGLGKEIISTEFNGKRLIFIGGQLITLNKDVTFHDVLIAHMIKIFGKDWFLAENAKADNEMHEILKWHKKLSKYNKKLMQDIRIASMPCTGAAEAYLHLAYALYCIEHNVTIPFSLIERLKIVKQFPGAYQETLVFAYLTRAGFQIEFQDEHSGKNGKGTRMHHNKSCIRQ